MEVNNARITNLTIGLDDRDRLSARMTFECHFGACDWAFILTNPKDAERMVKLMNYTGVHKVEALNGKIVRIVIHGSCFRGFGDPIEDKFVPALGEEFKEVTVEQFEVMLKNN